MHAVLWVLLLALCTARCARSAETRPQDEADGVLVIPEAECSNPGSWSRIPPQAGALVVDGSSSGRNTNGSPSFHTFSDAVAKLDRATLQTQTIFLLPGTYHEQVYIPPLQGPLVLQGYTCDARSYASNTVTLTHSRSLGDLPDGGKDDETATLRLWTPNVRVYNLNVVNTFGPHTPTKGQALALSASAGNQSFYACQLRGYQDTVMAETGAQLYAGCRIEGAVDFIFGQKAQAWFDRCDIRTVGPGCITASGRETDANPSWYVIHNSTVKAAAAADSTDGDGDDSNSAAGKTYLGRPWRDHARVVFQHTYLGAVVQPAGWSIWSKNKPNTEHVYLGEYDNYGPGSTAGASSHNEATASPKRASFGQQLASPIKPEAVLGPSWTTQWWADVKLLDAI